MCTTAGRNRVSVSHPDSYFFGENEMKNFAASVKNFLVSEDGPAAVEYAVMTALIVVVCVGTISNRSQAGVRLYAAATMVV